MTNSISFPALFDKVFEINRVAFNMFGKDVMWYGVILTVAVLAAAIYGMRRCDEFGWNQDQVVDGLLYCLPAAIIGPDCIMWCVNGIITVHIRAISLKSGTAVWEFMGLLLRQF